MIAGKKYNGLSVDIWSCGVILYAMLCGYLPFEDPNTTELYKKILKGDFEMPDFLSENAKDMLKKVLNTDPETRYKIAKIRDHPWYNLVEPEENDEGIMVGYKPIPIDPYIISELGGYNLDPEYAKKCLEANRHNEITTTYYLLVKKYQRDGKHKVVDPNSSLPIRKALDASFLNNSNSKNNPKSIISNSNISNCSNLADSAHILLDSRAKKLVENAPDTANTLETPQNDNSFSFNYNGAHMNLRDDRKRKTENGSNLTQYERNVNRLSGGTHNRPGVSTSNNNYEGGKTRIAIYSSNKNRKQNSKDTNLSSYKSTPKSNSMMDDKNKYKVKDAHPVNLRIFKDSKQNTIIEKLRKKMGGKTATRDIPDSIRKRASDISKNESYIDNNDTDLSGPMDWSFGIFAENNTNNDKLQKIYEIYQKVISQTKPSMSNNGTNSFIKPSSISKNEENIVPHPPSNPLITNGFQPRRQNRFVPKTNSPYAAKLDTSIRPSTRTQIRKKASSKGVRKTTSRMEDRAKAVIGTRGKNDSVGPITIIQAPLINTFNNYNSFNIENISLGHQTHEPSPGSKPLVSNFRLKKYKNAGQVIPKANKHNLSFAQ